MKMNKHWIWLLATICLVSTARSQVEKQVHAMSAREAVEYARKNSFEVKKALEDIRIQHQVNREVTSNALPQLNGSAAVNYSPRVAVQSFPNFIAAGTYGVLEQEGVRDANGNPIKAPDDFGIIAAQFGTKWNANAGLSLQQILFDGQVFVGLQARDAAMNFARKNAEITEENIAVNIYKVYYQLLIAQYQINLYHDNILRFEKLHHDTREIYKNGFAEKLDVDKVSVTLTNLRTDSLKLKTQMNNGFLGLKVLLGMPLADSVILTEKLTEEMVKSEILDTAYNYGDRREFQLLEIGKQLNEFNVKRYKYSYLPTLSAFGQLNSMAMRDQFNLFRDKWYSSSLIGVQLNVPIFDGFKRNSQIEQAKSAVKKSNYDMELLKLSIDRDVASSRNRFRDAIIAVSAQRENMKLAEDVFDQTKKKYDQGLGTNTEINTAQTELRTAQTNFFSALYDAAIAKVDYMKAVGKIF
ncbi:TolC family protein [Flavihumibacter solisilvae]|uniref:Transporter n=1 Tax=Flavihumibacter solisilvae TaxID=1349421 RepID=A0A0C1LL34_9BACT|nr:TolC family protein [Flavihumibacter solisilvae]KIC96043.1 transporter [Flavihumibacter solisilvae]